MSEMIACIQWKQDGGDWQIDSLGFFHRDTRANKKSFSIKFFPRAMKQHRAKEKNKLTHIELFIKLFNELGPSPVYMEVGDPR